jgi:[acyl-carrier-protein] S-malonyltransferase
MQSAADEVSRYLQKVEFKEPCIPLINNVDAHPLAAQHAKEALANHITCPVYFEQSVGMLIDGGASVFIEVGKGSVLVNLVKRIKQSTTRFMVEDEASMYKLLAQKE